MQNPINTQSFQPIQPQNPMITHSYQPTQMQNEIPLPYYLQQHEITKNQLSNFSQMPHAAESLQMTMNPYLMGGSSITSNKPLMVFTGTDPEYSVEDYLNAVTANLILNIGPEPINININIQKEQPKEKIWTIPFLLESPRNKEFQPPDLEIDFLIDSGAESNIINIPTWNEIKTLHPKLTPLATSSKLATAQGSTLVNYGKFNYFFSPQEQ